MGRGRTHRFGAGLSLNLGIDAGADPRPDLAPWVAPSIVSWGYYADSETSDVRVDVRNVTTSGSPVKVQFQLRHGTGKDAIIKTFDLDATEQNSPHQTNVIIVAIGSQRGKWYDLWWRYFSAGGSDPSYSLHQASAVYLPLPGEPDSS